MLRPRGALPALLFVALLAFAPATALAVDWPQFQGDAAHAGHGEGPEPPYAVAWSTEIPPGGPEGRFGLSAPIVAGGRVVAVGPRSVVVLDAATGVEERAIERELGPSVPAAIAETQEGPILVFTEGWGDGPELVGSSATPAGATSTPSRSPSGAGGTTDGFEGPSRVVGVSWPHGERRWEVDLPQVSRTGVTIVDDLAVVGTNDGTITAVDLSTGEVAWTVEAGGPVDQALAATDDAVLVPVRGEDTTAASLVAVDTADGAERWRTESASLAVIASAPAIAEDAAFVAFSDATVRAYALADGTERWFARVNQPAPWAPPATALEPQDDAGSNDVYVVDLAGQVYALDAASGARVWDHARNVGVFHPAPIVAGGVVLAGTIEGEVIAFDAATGDAVWHQDLGEGPIRAFAATGDAVVVVRGGADAGVVALTPDPGGALVEERSPTVVQPVRIAGNWAAATVVLGAALVLLGRLLWTRMGPPDLGSPDEDVDALVDGTEAAT